MSLRLADVGVEIEGRVIVEHVDIAVDGGRRLALLGPSGSGKSTLLRVAAGLRSPTSGRVEIDAVDVTAVPAHRRGVGVVFQDAALFPHLRVGRNVAYGLELAGVERAERDRRVGEALDQVGLAGFERRAVDELSGGEAQRVALARALAPEPRILLLDEPLASLDAPLRERLQTELRALFDRLALTVVHVTHDVAEAFVIGDQIAVLHQGRVEQVATPDALWEQPASEWVARFLGMRNIVRDGDGVAVVRPEAIRIVAGTGARVVAVEPRGATALVTVARADGTQLEAIVNRLERRSVGDEVAIEVDPAGVARLPG